MLTYVKNRPPATLILSAIVILAVCSGCDGAPVGKIVDKDKYAVVVRGDGESSFLDQYVAASKLIGQGKIAEAERIYHELAQIEPNSPNPYVGLGSCCLNREDPSGAREWYQKALQKQSNCVNAFIGLGTSYSQEHNFTNALASYERARALDDNSPEAHYGLTTTYLELGNKAEARLHFTRYKKLFPNSPYIASLEYYIERGPPTATLPVR
jgi:Flp pilus assembly protein TadD